jgi:hypothetical protein
MHFTAGQSKATNAPSHDEGSRSFTRPVSSKHPLSHPLPGQGLLSSQEGLLQRKCACGGTPGVDGECAECRNTRLQRPASSHANLETAPPIVHDVLRSPGQPLDPATRGDMEERFGHDFSRVRIHANTFAARTARTVDALAYTAGNHVIFGAGQYSPRTEEGRRLLAHELAHVVQSEAAPPGSSAPAISPPGSALEGEAAQAAARVMAGELAGMRPASAHMIFRQETPPDPRHARGFFGEQEMAFRGYRFEEGWIIIEGPSGAAGHGVTQSGFDASAYNRDTGQLHIVDNKSLARAGNVSSATAIDPEANLLQNVETTIQRVEAMSPKQMPERQQVLRLLRQTRAAVRGQGRIPGRVQLVVTGAGGRSTGVVARLSRAGVIFRDINAPQTPPPPGSAGPPLQGGPAAAPPSTTAQPQPAPTVIPSPQTAPVAPAAPGTTAAQPKPGPAAAPPSTVAPTTTPRARLGGRIGPQLRGIGGGVARGLAGAALALGGAWLQQRVHESFFNDDMKRIEPEINRRLDTLADEIVDIQTSQVAATVPGYAVITIETTYHHFTDAEPTGIVHSTVYAGTRLVSVSVSDSPQNEVRKREDDPVGLGWLRFEYYTVTYSVPLEPSTADQLRAHLLHRIEELEQVIASSSQGAEELLRSQAERDQLIGRLESL